MKLKKSSITCTSDLVGQGPFFILATDGIAFIAEGSSVIDNI